MTKDRVVSFSVFTLGTQTFIRTTFESGRRVSCNKRFGDPSAQRILNFANRHNWVPTVRWDMSYHGSGYAVTFNRPKPKQYSAALIDRHAILMVGYDPTSLTDETLSEIAREIGYNESVIDSYWVALRYECGEAGLTEINTDCPKCFKRRPVPMDTLVCPFCGYDAEAIDVD